MHSTLALLNFVAFLWNGRFVTFYYDLVFIDIYLHRRYRTLADRLLEMRLVSTQRATSRDVSYEFMNRQMVWHAFTASLRDF